MMTAIRCVIDALYRCLNPDLSCAFSARSHLTVKERICLRDCARGRSRIAEIGSYVGASACCFGAASCGTTDALIICIDTWRNDAMTEGSRNTWREFQTNTSHYRNRIIPVRGFSVDVVDQVKAITPTLDILFIDGDHSYGGVKADWEGYKGFLRAGSIVVFHDYGWAEGVKRVVHEDVLPLVSTADNLPNMWWGKLARAP